MSFNIGTNLPHFARMSSNIGANSPRLYECHSTLVLIALVLHECHLTLVSIALILNEYNLTFVPIRLDWHECYGALLQMMACVSETLLRTMRRTGGAIGPAVETTGDNNPPLLPRFRASPCSEWACLAGCNGECRCY